MSYQTAGLHKNPGPLTDFRASTAGSQLALAAIAFFDDRTPANFRRLQEAARWKGRVEAAHARRRAA